MAKGISLHIGINTVDPARYDGWDGKLNACEADAKAMLAIAKSQDFKSSECLFSKQATAGNVIKAIGKAAQQLVAGDMFFITYSGHGGQMADTTGDEDDKIDETWVLYDRQLIDDELYTMWGKFASGVRIL